MLVGILVTFVLCFILVLAATRNFYVSFIAMKTVAFIVGSVTMTMYLLGWQLGVSESIAMVIVIGFSIDYVVHLSTHYVTSKFAYRTDRARDAISAMGVSIFSGGMTTLGSGAFLFGG